jgi:hypothetical protein
MTKAKPGVPPENARKPRANRGRGKAPPLSLLLTNREHVDGLLDEALRATFPCSDPIAIGSARIQGIALPRRR